MKRVKRAMSLTTLLTIAVGIGVTPLASCEKYDFDIEYQFNVGDGDYDWTSHGDYGDEIEEPYNEAFAIYNNYYIVWTVDGKEITFPYTLKSDVTFVGNCYEYKSASNFTFLEGVDKDKLSDYIKENWWEGEDSEGVDVYYIQYGTSSANYIELVFYPEDYYFQFSKAVTGTPFSIGNIYSQNQDITQFRAAYGDKMSEATYISRRTNYQSAAGVASTQQLTIYYTINKLSENGCFPKHFMTLYETMHKDYNVKYSYRSTASSTPSSSDVEGVAEQLYYYFQDIEDRFNYVLQDIDPSYRMF